MLIILNKHHAKYKVNTAEDKGVTKLMSPLPTMSPFGTDVTHVADSLCKIEIAVHYCVFKTVIRKQKKKL